MVFDLSAGEVIRLGDSVTLTVLAVEGDCITFGLDTRGPTGPPAEDPGGGDKWADPRRNKRPWEYN
jgi:hypothetical protein